MIDPLRFFVFVMSSEVETSLTVAFLKHKRFLHFGRNDKIAIRRTWEDGS